MLRSLGSCPTWGTPLVLQLWIFRAPELLKSTEKFHILHITITHITQNYIFLCSLNDCANSCVKTCASYIVLQAIGAFLIISQYLVVITICCVNQFTVTANDDFRFFAPLYKSGLLSVLLAGRKQGLVWDRLQGQPRACGLEAIPCWLSQSGLKL